jgi:hypothetical protein
MRQIPNVLPENICRLYHMYQRASFIARKVLPSDALFAMQHTNDEVGWKTWEECYKEQPPKFGQTRNMWASFAASVNYISAAHVDDDFWLSCLMVLCADSNITYAQKTKFGGKSYYHKDIPTAVYFCLPQKGVAVGLKPDDYILFNPKEPHCVSMREKFYEAKQVYLVSFYLKTNVVGGNDNKDTNDVLKEYDGLKSFYLNANINTVPLLEKKNKC